MSIDFQQARLTMVENQLRPNRINNLAILNQFKNLEKEKFVLDNKQHLSYNDIDIELINNRGYLKNLHLAQLIHNSNINKNHNILHIGGLTGYFSIIISNLCNNLVVVENDERLLIELKQNINDLSIENIKVVNADFKEGYIEKIPYDYIIFDNPIDDISDTIKDQVSDKSGNILLIKRISKNLCKAYRINNNKNFFTEEYLFDVFTKFQLYNNENKFIF